MKPTRKNPKSGKKRQRRLNDQKSAEPDPVDGPEIEDDEGPLSENQDQFDDDDDGAPEEVPIDKTGASFIPLKAAKKRKRGKTDKTSQETTKSIKVETKNDRREKSEPKKPRRDNEFREKVPGHYFGSKKTKKFRVVDLSSNSNVQSSAHRNAIALKQAMFSRHRRVTGAQLLGIKHKSKMVGKR